MADAAMPDSMLPCKSFSSLFDTCALSPPTGNLTLTGDATYNTDTNMLIPARGGNARPAHAVVTTSDGSIDVLLVRNFSLSAGATLWVTGTRPFGIAATGNVTIDGVLDLSAGRAGARTATACATSTGGNGTDDSGGATGAGGGGFQGNGGAGGKGDNNSDPNVGPPGGAAGVAAQSRPKGLLGGCVGGVGGKGGATTAGQGGAGGGAVVIATAKTLTVSGAIDVGGGGGGGGVAPNGGGGGGGSGGMILLECKALSLTAAGAIVANGGGGGEGAGGLRDGNAGNRGTRTSEPALGGTDGAVNGAAGGNGGAGANNNGAAPAVVASGGGGGGGGGTGFIAIACPPFTNNGIISPAFAPWP